LLAGSAESAEAAEELPDGSAELAGADAAASLEAQKACSVAAEHSAAAELLLAGSAESAEAAEELPDGSAGLAAADAVAPMEAQMGAVLLPAGVRLAPESRALARLARPLADYLSAAPQRPLPAAELAHCLRVA
jgi:hypothetical protein